MAGHSLGERALVRAVRAALGALLMALALAGSARAATTPTDALEVIAGAIAKGADESGGARAAAVGSVAALGVGALPDLFDVLDHSVSLPGPADGRPTVDRRAEALLLEALHAWPRERVVAIVVDEAREGSLTRQLLGVRLVGEVADAESIGPLLELASGLRPAHRQNRLVHEALSAALANALRRDHRTYRVLGDAVRELDPALLPAVAHALGDVGDGAAVDVLKRMMDRSQRIDLAALAALGRLKRWDPAVVDGEAAEVISFRLDALSPKVRRQAALALGELRDTSAFLVLVDMLEDEDGRVRQGAQVALEQVTGLGWPPDPDRWRAYYNAQLVWLDVEAPALVDVALGDDPQASVRALRELATHGLLRRELTKRIAPALHGADEDVVLAACAALARLGDASAVAPLVHALEDARSAVRERADASLRALTGRTPVDGDAISWRRWL